MDHTSIKRTSYLLVPVMLIALTGFWIASLRAEDKPEKEDAEQVEQEDDGKPKPLLRDFMRLKLKASNMVLEGLATEDMLMIKEGATQLNKMSGVEQWRVHNDAMYKQFSGEFQRATQSLVNAADNDNIDQAALQWMAITMNCIECHRYVRNELVVDGF